MSKFPYHTIPGLRRALREDLNAKNLIQQDMADHFGISQQAVNRWFVNEQIPLRKIEGVIEFFGADSKTAKMLNSLINPEITEAPGLNQLKHIRPSRQNQYERRDNRISALGQAALEALTEALAQRRISDESLLRHIADWKGVGFPSRN